MFASLQSAILDGLALELRDQCISEQSISVAFPVSTTIVVLSYNLVAVLFLWNPLYRSLGLPEQLRCSW